MSEELMSALAAHMASGKPLIMGTRKKLEIGQVLPGFKSSLHGTATVRQPVVIKREATFDEYWDNGPEGLRPPKELIREQAEAEGAHFYEVSTD